MNLITLLTDYGTKDHYVASVKGKLYSESPSTQIIDISHQVSPFNIQQAAFILSNSYHQFPEGTVHLVAVNETSGDIQADSPDKLVAIQYNKHFFVGCDNGIFSLIMENPATIIVNIENSENQSFPTLTKLANAALHLTNGGDISDLGWPTENLKELNKIEPGLSKNRIDGKVLYVDNYGNLITNIHKSEFDKIHRKRKIFISFERQELRTIHTSYNEVEKGMVMSIFNEQGNLEIAINTGNASELFDLNIGSDVQINFKPTID